MATKAWLESKLEECRRMNQELQNQCNELDGKLHLMSMKLKQADVELEAAKRDLRGEQSIIKQIRFACSHRIKVSYDCDVERDWTHNDKGESIPVPVCEEVRFLREIVRLCGSNEVPF